MDLHKTSSFKMPWRIWSICRTSEWCPGGILEWDDRYNTASGHSLCLCQFLTSFLCAVRNSPRAFNTEGHRSKTSHCSSVRFILLAGDRDVIQYTREDAKLFVRHLEMTGNKTSTIRRRINSPSARLNYAYAELDLYKLNPFSRLIIKAEGKDNFKRGTFSNEQLKEGYKIALASGSQVKLLMPLVGKQSFGLQRSLGWDWKIFTLRMTWSIFDQTQWENLRPITARGHYQL